MIFTVFFLFFFPPDILQGNFKPDYYLKHIQKDLRLAISMGDSVNHPTPMAAAANEVRKLRVCDVYCTEMSEIEINFCLMIVT